MSGFRPRRESLFLELRQPERRLAGRRREPLGIALPSLIRREAVHAIRRDEVKCVFLHDLSRTTSMRRLLLIFLAVGIFTGCAKKNVITLSGSGDFGQKLTGA